MKPFVTQIWPQFTADAQFNACFGQVLVERVELYRTARKVIICLRSAEPLDGGLCGRLAASLEPVFEGYELTLKNYFNYGNITPEAARLMIEELKAEGLPVNGFLDKSPISIQDGVVTIHVAAGMNILESIDFPRRLAERIQERTGTLPMVRMAATGKTVAPEEFEKYVQNKAPAVKFEAKKDMPPIQIQGLALADKPVKVFHGKTLYVVHFHDIIVVERAYTARHDIPQVSDCYLQERLCPVPSLDWPPLGIDFMQSCEACHLIGIDHMATAHQFVEHVLPLRNHGAHYAFGQMCHRLVRGKSPGQGERFAFV